MDLILLKFFHECQGLFPGPPPPDKNRSYNGSSFLMQFQSQVRPRKTKQNHVIRLIFFARAFGKTDSAVSNRPFRTFHNEICLPFTVHALRFTHLWDKNLLPNGCYDFFHYTSSLQYILIILDAPLAKISTNH